MAWSKCQTCGKEIPFGGIYLKCSVSSCKKTVFCSDTCWDIHSPQHKSSWAEEERAPTSGQRRVVSSPSKKNAVPKEVLVVASKLKAYIKSRSDFNTSGNVFDHLSELVRVLADEAIDKARSEGRKTVMDRDFRKPSEL